MKRYKVTAKIDNGDDITLFAEVLEEESEGDAEEMGEVIARERFADRLTIEVDEIT